MVTANQVASLSERLRGIGISGPYASQLANGRRTPSLQLALRIERELGVPVGSWVRPDEVMEPDGGDAVTRKGCEVFR